MCKYFHLHASFYCSVNIYTKVNAWWNELHTPPTAITNNSHMQKQFLRKRVRPIRKKTRHKNVRGDGKLESNDRPEISELFLATHASLVCDTNCWSQLAALATFKCQFLTIKKLAPNCCGYIQKLWLWMERWWRVRIWVMTVQLIDLKGDVLLCFICILLSLLCWIA